MLPKGSALTTIRNQCAQHIYTDMVQKAEQLCEDRIKTVWLLNILCSCFLEVQYKV